MRSKKEILLEHDSKINSNNISSELLLLPTIVVPGNLPTK